MVKPRYDSAEMAARARKNKRSPWRTKPHVDSPNAHRIWKRYSDERQTLPPSE